MSLPACRTWLAALVAAAACAAGAGEDIWLTSIQPFTGADWDAGVSMRVGAEIMLEKINAHSTLLSGHTLRVAWQDGLCARRHGSDLFLTNLFDQRYAVFAPNTNLDGLDVDGDGIITTSETAPLGEIWTSAQVSGPVGLLGPGCSGTAIDIVNIAYKARWPIVSNSATRPGLSDRTAYPNFFRTILPDTFYNAAWIGMAKMLTQNTVVPIIGETQNWASMGTQLVSDAAAQGVALAGLDLSAEIAGLTGLQMAIESQTAASAIASELVRVRQRIVILLMFDKRARLLLCEAYQKGFVNAVYMSFGWFAGGWWTVDDTACTPAQVTSQVTGLITANMMHWRSDENTLLTCAEGTTSRNFREEWHTRQGATFGQTGMLPEGYFVAQEGATTADAVCMYALMLQEVLVNQNVPLADLRARTQAAYDAIQTALAATSFEGLQGRVRFEANKADPQGSIIVQQQQGGVLVDIASYNKPDFVFFGTAPLTFAFGETFTATPGATSITAPMQSFADCPAGKSLRFSDNTCQDCPAGEVYVPSAGICACQAGWASAEGANGDECGACPSGKYTSAPGELACAECEVGKFVLASGSTECEYCAPGFFTEERGQSACVQFTQDVWLTSIQPFTGADWDAGISMRIGAEIMLDEINRHPTLLSGFNLKVVWQDGLCAKPVGTSIFMKNLFDKKYEAFAPDTNLTDLDADGNGVITTSETAPLMQEWDSTQVYPDPVGLLGSGCAGTALNIAGTAYQARIPMISNSATRSSLSDRSLYPNFYRTILPDTFNNAAWVAMAMMLGQTSGVVVIGETENWESMGARVASVAAEKGFTLLGVDLSAEIAGLNGLQISIDSENAARDIATELIALKQRVVILQLFASRGRLVLCEAHKQGYANAVFMSFGWFAYGWWAVPDTDCTPVEMTSMATGLITGNMKFFRTDDTTQLSCAQTMTARAWKEEWYARQGASIGDLSMRPEGYAPALEAATTADAVCMYAQMLHEVLITRTKPLADLAAKTREAYTVIQEVLAATDFEGIQGRVRYAANSADPKGSVIIQQLHSSGFVDIADYNDPDLTFLGVANLVFDFDGESFPAGPAGATSITAQLTPYVDCPAGKSLDFRTNTCVDCPANKTYVAILGSCVCTRGFAVDPNNPSACIQCQPGTFTGEPGNVQCKTCPEGQFSSNIGTTECDRCPQGTYNNMTGTTECISCNTVLRGSTTQFIEVKESSACTCRVGTYTEGAECIECSEGMKCEEFGMDAPEQEPGYMIAPGDAASRDFSVYRCRNLRECAGGVAGTCPPSREEIGCSHCEDGTSPDDLGACNPCGGSSAVLMVLAAICCTGMLLLMTFYSRLDITKTNLNTLAVGICMGQVVIASQMLTVLSVLTVTWVEPIRSFIKFVSIMSFRIELLNISCIMSSSNVVGMFFFKLLIFPMAASTLVGIFLLQVKVFKINIPVNNMLNSLGLIFLVLYMTLTLVSITPFQCLNSPNGTMSMASDPSVICGGNGDYIGLAILGAIGMSVYSVAFFAWISWVTYQYPKMVAAGKGFEIMSRYRFLFQRFEVDRFYYAPLYLLRSFLLALIPVVFANYGHRQVLFFCGVMIFFGMLQAYLQPWRGTLPNIMDMMVSSLMVLTLLCAALLLGFDEVDVELIRRDMTTIFALLLAALMMSMFGVIGFLMYLRFFPKRQFLAFLSHHKVGCAAGARMLKMELTQRCSGKVFLDSDDLDSLDKVLEYVRSGSDKLIVMMTGETLWRPWCAGEIVTAYKNSVSTLCIQYDDYHEPTDEELSMHGLHGKWTPEAFGPISLQGISLEDVAVAFRWIRDMEKWQARRVGYRTKQDHGAYLELVNKVAGYLGGRRLDNAAAGSDHHGEASIPIIACNADAEAVSTAQILAMMVQTSTQKLAEPAFDVSDLWKSGSPAPSHTVVLLTPGCLTAKAWSEMVVKIRTDALASDLCCMRVPEFMFPSKEHFETSVYPQVAKALGIDVDEVRRCYTEVTTILAFSFVPAEQMAVMQAQANKLTNKMTATKSSDSRALTFSYEKRDRGSTQDCMDNEDRGEGSWGLATTAVTSMAKEDETSEENDHHFTI